MILHLMFCTSLYRWSCESSAQQTDSRACRLEESSNVTYYCPIDELTAKGYRKCNEYEVEGTIVLPECKPNYHSPSPLPFMFCINGHWSHNPKCQPESKTTIPQEIPFVVDCGIKEIPWQLFVYVGVSKYTQSILSDIYIPPGSCRLDESASLEYYCLVIDDQKVIGMRKCKKYEEEGTTVVPECKEPDYYSPTPLPHMFCFGERWSHDPKCQLRRENPIPQEELLVVNNKIAYQEKVLSQTPIFKENVNKYVKIIDLINETPNIITGSCKLEDSPSVNYYCLIDGLNLEKIWECEKYVMEGTTVLPKCKQPNYYSLTPLTKMLCLDGRWNYIPKCEPECGILIPQGEPLVVGGKMAYRGEVPWVVPIYFKLAGKFTQICSGNLVSEKHILTAAHCVWDENDGLLSASMFKIAVGKVYRNYDDMRDAPYVQKSNVKEIFVAPRFSGAELLFQNDLAILIAETPFVFGIYVRPICLNFSQESNEYQLRDGTVGKVAGFGLTNRSLGSESEELKVVKMPYVGFDDCKKRTPAEYAMFLVGTKFCAGYGNGVTALCKGDSGAGYAVAELVRGMRRYYLRGVLSTAPPSPDGASCNLHALTSFTEMQAYEQFVRRYWP